MTFVGKVFLMVNLALSLAMMAAGAGLYATRTDWTEAAAKGNAPPGVSARKKAELKAAMETIHPAENSFKVALTALEGLETQRYKDRVFYSDELAQVRTRATARAPARAPVLAAGLPTLDKAGRPTLMPANDRKGNPLESMAAYATAIAQKQKEDAAVLAELKTQFELDAKETEKLTGTPTVRGLRQHLLDEIIKREGITEEIDATRPLFINTRVEAAIVKERIAAIGKQVKALQDTLEKMKKLDAR